MKHEWQSKAGDRAMTLVIRLAGLVLVACVAAILFYLAKESRFAFDRKFDFGYRFALQPRELSPDYQLSLDPNASLLTVNREGAEGLDEKEEGIPWPSLEQLAGAPGFGTGSPLQAANAVELYRDDWRAMNRAEEGERFVLYGFANDEYREREMAIAWEPDASFDPKLAPYRMTLRLLRAPKGVVVEPFEIDLKNQPTGRLVIPTYVAKSDAERTSGYAFELIAEPASNSFLATLSGVFRSEWSPTLSYARYGVAPLLLGTFLITLLALLVAAPIGIAAALYLNEFASSRLRNWVKPVLELLASVPTVVLGYLGLMLIAPWLQRTLGEALGLDSGRSLLTASIVMGVLLIPSIVTVAEDALRSVPKLIRDGGLALGLTPFETLRRLTLPAAKAGLCAALLLGFARAVGETMIVWILSGGTPTMPSFGSLADTASNLGRPTRGVADTVAIEMGNVAFEGVHYGHLFLLGLVLFLSTLVLNLAAQRLIRRTAWQG